MTLALHKIMIVTGQKFSQVMGRLSINKLVNVYVICKDKKKVVFKRDDCY